MVVRVTVNRLLPILDLDHFHSALCPRGSQGCSNLKPSGVIRYGRLRNMAFGRCAVCYPLESLQPMLASDLASYKDRRNQAKGISGACVL